MRALFLILLYLCLLNFKCISKFPQKVYLEVLMNELEIEGFFDTDNDSIYWVLPITMIYVFPFVSSDALIVCLL